VRKGGPVSLRAQDQVLRGGILRFLTTFHADADFGGTWVGATLMRGFLLAIRTPRLGGSPGDPIGNVFVMLITNRKDNGKRDDGLTAVGSFLHRDE